MTFLCAKMRDFKRKLRFEHLKTKFLYQNSIFRCSKLSLLIKPFFLAFEIQLFYVFRKNCPSFYSIFSNASSMFFNISFSKHVFIASLSSFAHPPKKRTT